MMRWGIFALTALAVVSIDQITKAVVVSRLNLYESWAPVEALAHLFTITHTTNTGVAFGLFPGAGALFLVITAVAAVGLVIYYHRLPEQESWAVRVALGLMLGGAVGNLIDRVRLGHVIDFLHLSFWPVFNIADAGIVLGVLLLMGAMFWEERREAFVAES